MEKYFILIKPMQIHSGYFLPSGTIMTEHNWCNFIGRKGGIDCKIGSDNEWWKQINIVECMKLDSVKQIIDDYFENHTSDEVIASLNNVISLDQREKIEQSVLSYAKIINDEQLMFDLKHYKFNKYERAVLFLKGYFQQAVLKNKNEAFITDKEEIKWLTELINDIYLLDEN